MPNSKENMQELVDKLNTVLKSQYPLDADGVLSLPGCFDDVLTNASMLDYFSKKQSNPHAKAFDTQTFVIKHAKALIIALDDCFKTEHLFADTKWFKEIAKPILQEMKNIAKLDATDNISIQFRPRLTSI
jgi:hypothetical protein